MARSRSRFGACREPCPGTRQYDAPEPWVQDQAAKPNAGWMSKRYLSATWFKTRRAARNR